MDVPILTGGFIMDILTAVYYATVSVLPTVIFLASVSIIGFAIGCGTVKFLRWLDSYLFLRNLHKASARLLGIREKRP